MADIFLGEIRLFSFPFPPKGWALCNGQFLAIAQNQALFALLGTTYGGNGTTTFALPNLQGNIPIHRSSNFVLGQVGGEQNHTLTLAEMTSHTHLANASPATATQAAPTDAIWANGNQSAYNAGTPNAVMYPGAVNNNGNSQAHTNMPPYLVINFCIALQGIFPSHS